MPGDLPHLDDLVDALTNGDAASDLDRVAAAVTIAAELGSLGDQLVTHFVQASRAAGRSWAQIGEQLGVSKQAAQQGSAARLSYLDENARAVVALAEEHARARNHKFVGTEHLLLGILGQLASVAARILHEFGIETDAVLVKIDELAGRGAGQPRSRRPSFGPRSKKVLQLALREAQAPGKKQVGTEHLLLGILSEGEGLAAQILVALGADLPKLREAVTTALP